MIEAVQRGTDSSVLAFVLSSMLVMGMSQRLGDVLAPLKNPRMVTAALLVNFVAAPGLALLLSRVIPLQPAHAVGLLLLGGFAIATYLLFLTALVLMGVVVGLALMLGIARLLCIRLASVN